MALNNEAAALAHHCLIHAKLNTAYKDLDKMQVKLFPNFTSIPFDYLLISLVTNYVSNLGFFWIFDMFILYRIDRELHSLKCLDLKFGL